MPANSAVTEIIATTIENRSKELADSILDNNALLSKLKDKGNVRSISGGSQIFEEIAYQENSNVGWYSGYDPISVAQQEGITAATYSLKQLACAVTISGLEKLQNSGKEQMIDLIAQRVKIAESTMTNTMAEAIYGDGTAAGGKAIVGLGAFVTSAPSTGTVGGIDRANNTWWRNHATGSLGSQTAGATFLAYLATAYNSTVRGKDKVDILVGGNAIYGVFEGSLTPQQRFTNPKMAELGFESYKFKGADFVLDGGIGGNMAANVILGLNTDYIFLRPHADRNMVPLGGDRVSVNQDASTKLIAWAGAFTMSGGRYHFYFQAS